MAPLTDSLLLKLQIEDSFGPRRTLKLASSIRSEYQIFRKSSWAWFNPLSIWFAKRFRFTDHLASQDRCGQILHRNQALAVFRD
jgi:hypothetical protein